MALTRSLLASLSIAGAVVLIASSCANTTSNRSGLHIVTEPDGAMYEVTDSGGRLPVTISDDGAVTTYPDQYIPPPDEAGESSGTSSGGSSSGAGSSGGSSGATSSSGAGTDASMSSSSSGAGDGSASCPDAAAPNNCAASVATGAITLSSNYLTSAAAGLGSGGYAYSYSDAQNGAGGTSTICLDSNALCAQGSTDVSNSTGTHYGAGIGFNLNQAHATGCTSTPIDAFTVPANSVGISYHLSNLPPGGVRIAIGNFVSGTPGPGNEDYCATVSSAQGTIPWATFNTQCWSNTGTFLSAPPAAPTHIEFGLPSGTATSAFDFCVDSVGFATALSTPDSGTTGTACNGNSCCEPGNGPSTNNGELTCYTFNQAGSPPIGQNLYKSFCGYTVSEASGGGNNNGICESGQLDYTDTVSQVNGKSVVGTNPEYFVAFPTGNGGWGSGTYCGMCVNVTYAGQTQMATVIDECPSGSCPTNGGHLDMNAALARALNLGEGNGTGDATSGVSWKAVECPVTGNIQAIWNNNNPAGGQVYFQNVVWPIKSVSGASQSNGYWSTVTNGSTVTLTDILGHQITATITSGDIGAQFPASCN